MAKHSTQKTSQILVNLNDFSTTCVCLHV